jgi:hypothetical protein
MALVYLMVIWNILGPFGIFYGHVVMWYIFHCYSILRQEKSGKPGLLCKLLQLPKAKCRKSFEC